MHFQAAVLAKKSEKNNQSINQSRIFKVA